MDAWSYTCFATHLLGAYRDKFTLPIYYSLYSKQFLLAVVYDLLKKDFTSSFVIYVWLTELRY